MFSGKTTELFRRIKRYTAAHENCLVVRYEKDNRYSSLHASTHDREMLKATGASALAQIADLVSQYDVIGVDEGQFYPDIVEMTELFASQGKKVVISALDGDFRRKPFGRVLELVPMAESVTKLTAVCTFCHNDAPFTRRITTETAIEVIGGADKLRDSKSVAFFSLLSFIVLSCQVCCVLPQLLFQAHGSAAP
jgi:thymidine kinase